MITRYQKRDGTIEWFTDDDQLITAVWSHAYQRVEITVRDGNRSVASYITFDEIELIRRAMWEGVSKRTVLSDSSIDREKPSWIHPCAGPASYYPADYDPVLGLIETK